MDGGKKADDFTYKNVSVAEDGRRTATFDGLRTTPLTLGGYKMFLANCFYLNLFLLSYFYYYYYVLLLFG